MKIVYVDKCENCPHLFFTEADCKYTCKAQHYLIMENDQSIPSWCPLPDAPPNKSLKE